MSLQSETTLNSEEESLEDVVLELMKGTGFLANFKGQIAKFITDSAKIGGDQYIIAERANEQTLCYIYEYLQWIGMKQTCGVLLSESPVKVDTSSLTGVKHSNPDYRPKLHTLLKNQPTELDSKFLSFRKSEELIPVSKTSSSFMYKTPSARSFDDLLLESKKSEPSVVQHIQSVDDSLLTSTPAAADATFVKNGSFKDKNNSSLLMGFETPVSGEMTSQSNRKKSSFVPEKLFQDKEDPFQALLRKHKQEDEEDDIIAKSKTLPILTDSDVPTTKDESPTPTAEVSKSVEQFIQEEERLKALQEQDEDLKKMEDEVMESSISTDWSDDEPNKPGYDEEPNGSLNPEEINVNVGDNADNDRSKLYEFSDDFEEDKDSSSNNNYLRNQTQNKEAGAEKTSKKAVESEVTNSKSQTSVGKEAVVSNGHISPVGDVKDLDKPKTITPPKKIDVSGEADDASTSDLLSMSIDMEVEDEDTKDISIPSDSLGMSSCDHVVNIK